MYATAVKMIKPVICVALLINLLFVGVQCKPVKDAEGDGDHQAETETVANQKTLEPGETYEKVPEMYIASASGSGSGDDEEVTNGPVSSFKIYCPPAFVEMWMKVFESYPDKCMKEGNSDDSDDSDNEANS